MQAIQYIGTITWIKITPQKILLNLMNKRRHFKVMCVLFYKLNLQQVRAKRVVLTSPNESWRIISFVVLLLYLIFV